MKLPALVEDDACTGCGVTGKIKWGSPDKLTPLQRGECQLCLADVRRLIGYADTRWSDREDHNTGLPFMRTGSRWDRTGNGHVLTVTRQVPPGVRVTASSHPHELRYCWWVDGEFAGVCVVVEMMGCVTRVMSELEDAAGVKKEAKHAWRLSMDDAVKLPPYHGGRVILQQYLTAHGWRNGSPR